MQKITPNLWFNRNAKEAVEFYISVFSESKIIGIHNYPDEGLADVQKEFAGQEVAIDFELSGFRFTAINADDTFTPTPAISMMLNFDPKYNKKAQTELEEIWEKLEAGGNVLMPLDNYPFSERYGWVQDKYGFSWQLILTDPEGEDRPFIIPALLFITDSGMVAEEATEFYMSVLEGAKRGRMVHYPAGMGNNKEGAVMFTDFTLASQWFMAMDGSARDHQFSFNEAVSLLIACKDQAEIDYYWEALTKKGGEEGMCGWLKDNFGVSWQVTPMNIDELLILRSQSVANRVSYRYRLHPGYTSYNIGFRIARSVDE